MISCVCSCFVCLSVCALRGKQLELSTSRSVEISLYSVAVPRQGLAIRSKVKIRGYQLSDPVQHSAKHGFLLLEKNLFESGTES